MKKTKIICTIGPASEQKEQIKSLVDAGMNVMRMNFSHGDYEEQGFRIKNVKELNEENNSFIGICLDTKGPEIRTGYLKDNAPIMLEKGNLIRITMDYSYLGDENKIAMSYPGLFDDLSIGGTILCEDGNISLTVLEKDYQNRELICRINNSRKLGNKRNVDVPGEVLNMEFISQKDYNDIVFACEQDLDFISASFVRRKEDILAIRKILEEHNNTHIKLISKIENQEGVNNMDEIIALSDGVMVARGDLGVNVDLWELPQIQKEIIRKASMAGKISVVATQMLDSMTYNPRPTRAEVTDVHSAVLDGVSATMLSGETAQGYYPKEAVTFMSKIEEVAEDFYDYDNFIVKRRKAAKGQKYAELAYQTCSIALEPDVRLIMAEGDFQFANMLSSFKPFVECFIKTTKEDAKLMSLLYGVRPFTCSNDEMLEKLKEEYNLGAGSKILVIKKNKIEKITL